MILLKNFLRKKSTKIYIVIFNIILTILFILGSLNNYFKSISDNLMNKHNIFILYANDEKNKLLENENQIESYLRILLFESSTENDLILSNGENLKNNDSSSNLLWSELYTHEKKIVTLPASYCNVKLNKNQVILASSSYKKKSLSTNVFIDEEIIFKNNDMKITLIIKELLPSSSNPYICISNDLYDNLLKKEENFDYLVRTLDYKSMENISKKWSNLKDKGEIDFYYGTFLEAGEDNNIEQYENMINAITNVTIISFIVFIIIILFVINDLLLDERKTTFLLKNIGFNKKQNILYLLINILTLDIITFIASIFSYNFIRIIINYCHKFDLKLYNNFFIVPVVIIIIFEVVFSIIHIKNIHC